MKNKKKIFVLIILIIFLIFNFSFVSAADSNVQPSLVSEAAILMDNKTNKILYSKNENKKMYPASTTKIMTAILTIENCVLNDNVTASYDAVTSIPDGYSTAYIQVGETLTVEQLLQLLLVHSANDAANVLAEYVGGSIDSFVTMMNTKAHDLNVTGWHFPDTFAMHDENHNTTAFDLAILMQYCMKNDTFRKIAGSASCSIPATNKYGVRSYNSTNELIIPNNKNYYQYVTAGKTGYTSQAGDCLVSCSYKDDLELICVVLGGKTVNGVSTRFSESRELYEYGYNNYSIKTLINKDSVVSQIEIENATKDTKNLDLLISQDITALVNNSENYDNLVPELNINETVQAPIDEGTVIGTAVYDIDGIQYTSNLIASHYVEESKFLEVILKIGILIVVALLIFEIFHTKKKKSRKKIF